MKGYHLSIERYERGTFSVKKWYIIRILKRQGLDLVAELEFTPPPEGLFAPERYSFSPDKASEFKAVLALCSIYTGKPIKFIPTCSVAKSLANVAKQQEAKKRTHCSLITSTSSFKQRSETVNTNERYEATRVSG